MKTIANFGLMDVISEDNKDTINFNHSSGKVTFELIFNEDKVTIKNAYWRHYQLEVVLVEAKKNFGRPLMKK